MPMMFEDLQCKDCIMIARPLGLRIGPAEECGHKAEGYGIKLCHACAVEHDRCQYCGNTLNSQRTEKLLKGFQSACLARDKALTKAKAKFDRAVGPFRASVDVYESHIAFSQKAYNDSLTAYRAEVEKKHDEVQEAWRRQHADGSSAATAEAAFDLSKDILNAAYRAASSVMNEWQSAALQLSFKDDGQRLSYQIANENRKQASQNIDQQFEKRLAPIINTIMKSLHNAV